MPSASAEWEMGGAARRLIDWGTAAAVGSRLARVASIPPLERARLREDLSEVVAQGEELVTGFTGLVVSGYRSRAWVQNRSEWIDANLRGFQRVIEPVAERVVGRHPRGPVASARRKLLGAQVGALTGYLSRKVLGQYDLFLPPDDDGLIYFVGQNVLAVEQRHRFPPRDFRLWLALHEVTHRVQFGAVPWLRRTMGDMIDSYLSQMELDPRRLLESLRRAVDEARRSREWRGLGILFLLMTPAQRDTFRRMQALMTVLEGHANFVMNGIAEGNVRDWRRMRVTLRQRRQRASGVERAFQRAIGFDQKVMQYDVGERFVASVVEQAGMEGFNRIWEDQANLPTLPEVARPEAWLSRVVPG